MRNHIFFAVVLCSTYSVGAERSIAQTDPASITPKWHQFGLPKGQPFDTMPKSLPIPESDDQSGNSPGPKAAVPSNPKKSTAKLKFVYVFDKNAYFTLPLYLEEHAPASGDGVLIYEGMKVSCCADGEFDLEMIATIPERPVTLLLQLRFEKSLCHEPFTITLPPISIKPKTRSSLSEEPQLTFRIEHHGNSFQLKETICTALIGPITMPKMARTGVARFGSTIPSSLQPGLSP